MAPRLPIRPRERAFLTPRQLVARAGLARATVHRIDRGATQAGITTVQRLTAALRGMPGCAVVMSSRRA